MQLRDQAFGLLTEGNPASSLNLGIGHEAALGGIQSKPLKATHPHPQSFYDFYVFSFIW